MRVPTVLVAGIVLLAACGGAGRRTDVHADVSRAASPATDAPPAAGAVNRFAFQLLAHQLGLSAGDVAVSPWSVAASLAMVRDGARGPTASEINRLLSAVPDEAMNALAQQLAARNGTFGSGSVEVDSANRVFADQGLPIDNAFLNALAANYGAAVGLAEFEHATEQARQQINAWVSGQTHGRITALIKPGTLDPTTKLVLVNAVYLRADWQQAFHKAETAPGVFHAPGGDVTVPFMHGSENGRHVAGPGWQAVDLDYAGDQLALAIVLPDHGAFGMVAAQLPSVLAALDAAPQDGTGGVAIPKFAVDHSLSLKQTLSALGMPTAFTDQADFGGISSAVALRLADVVHEADIRVDEKGTVAAAATASEFVPVAGVLQAFVADRPFFFLLHDRPTGVVLFAGQVTDPASANP